MVRCCSATKDTCKHANLLRNSIGVQRNIMVSHCAGSLSHASMQVSKYNQEGLDYSTMCYAPQHSVRLSYTTVLLCLCPVLTVGQEVSPHKIAPT